MSHKAGKRTEDTSGGARAPYRQSMLDIVLLAGTLLIVLLMSLFPVRSNDIWWHMAVGKELIESRAFITQDPFTFTVTGSPWVPHAYLASILFYMVHMLGSISGLIALRAVLVLAVFAQLFRILKRAEIPFALAAPFILLGVLVIQTRFLLRPHLFEYLFILLLLGFLLFNKSRSAIRFYGPPVLLQIVWVNTHASFYIGPLIVALVAAGEFISSAVNRCKKPASGGRRTLDRQKQAGAFPEFAWQPLAVLLLLLIAASFVNPSPGEFVLQPLGGEQRELITKYTLEWRSPFDPVTKLGAFHPYYEIFLVLAMIGIVLAVLQKRFGAVLLIGVFAYLSLQAHRFRVELVLVTLPLLLIGLKNASASPSLQKLLVRRQGKGSMAIKALALVLVTLLVICGRDRFVIGGGISARHPVAAMNFIRAENIAQRPFHTIGFGSYLLWHLYPARRSFIDGRNFHTALYKDFIECQTNVTGLRKAIDKYDLDAFILPVPGRSDSGIKNLHFALDRFDEWTLVHIDSIAFVYARNDDVPPAWLERNAYRFYRPLTFASAPPADSVLCKSPVTSSGRYGLSRT
ncbi:MAG: hypothetical protein ABIA59_06110 [Candidatus Latescibacterota bacterium]